MLMILIPLRDLAFLFVVLTVVFVGNLARVLIEIFEFSLELFEFLLQLFLMGFHEGLNDHCQN